MKSVRIKPLDEDDHRALALWAADCAERVLLLFEEKYPEDDRPRAAIEAARAWTRGHLRVGPAQAAAVAAHAAARAGTEGAARAAARSAGQAAGTAHIAGHARHAAAYAAKAVGCAAVPTRAALAAATEHKWQRQHLREQFRRWVFPPAKLRQPRAPRRDRASVKGRF